MKRIVFLISTLMIVLLCGCTEGNQFPANNTIDIDSLESWSFQYNESTSDYSLFFGFKDSSGKFVSSKAKVDIRIVNENNEQVFSATKSVTEKDFDYYTSKVGGKQFLTDLRIKKSEIKPGTSQNGKVYFKVYNDEVLFDEVNCDAFLCLPVKDVKLKYEKLPKEISIKDYEGNVESIIKIENIEYTYSNEISPSLSITVKGTKTFGSDDSFDDLECKLYDSKGYLIETENIFLDSLSTGDKFKDDSLIFYEISPGETYTIKFTTN